MNYQNILSGLLTSHTGPGKSINGIFSCINFSAIYRNMLNRAAMNRYCIWSNLKSSKVVLSCTLQCVKLLNILQFWSNYRGTSVSVISCTRFTVAPNQELKCSLLRLPAFSYNGFR